jgi:hypothetical protein
VRSGKSIYTQYICRVNLISLLTQNHAGSSQQGLETLDLIICKDPASVAHESRSFCEFVEYTTAYFRQLASPAGSLDDRRVLAELEIYPELLIPTVQSLSHFLSKLIQDQATTVMITPLWPTQSWFPILLELAVDVLRMF